MNRVYSNGICNLAASFQSTSNRGLFCNRDPTKGASFTVESFWNDGDDAEKVELCPNFASLFTEFGPLYRRAWVAQEQELSPRTIHMAPFPVWECRETILTEHFPSEEALGRYRSLFLTTKITLGKGDLNEAGLMMNWNKMIFLYSRCGLTKDSDKLIALCGVAKAFSQFTQSKYFAGIWENHLHSGLLWRPIESVGNITIQGETWRYKEYIAPSWTWASVKGAILACIETIDAPLADVLNVETQLSNGDPFGQLCGGRLTLFGVLFKFPGIREMVLKWENFALKPSYSDEGLAFDDCGIDDYGCLDSWFMPVAIASAVSRNPELNICGIVLQKATGTSETVAYTRVGYAVVSDDGDIAGSGWLIRDWIPRPWSKDSYRKIEIV
ncbi:hypothetical protein NW759_011161 [Fusarium solani]|nr:hypothetical protein NW759_011161 [Fusarium solani]